MNTLPQLFLLHLRLEQDRSSCSRDRIKSKSLIDTELRVWNTLFSAFFNIVSVSSSGSLPAVYAVMSYYSHFLLTCIVLVAAAFMAVAGLTFEQGDVSTTVSRVLRDDCRNVTIYQRNDFWVRVVAFLCATTAVVSALRYMFGITKSEVSTTNLSMSLSEGNSNQTNKMTLGNESLPIKPAPILQCIRKRRSVFPRSYDRNSPDVSKAVMERLLEAAMWAPYHGSIPPWRFVVLGKNSMVDMQHLTLDYYDRNWRTVGWADGKTGNEKEYLKWRNMTENEIAGRWGPVSFMVAIVMRRQAGSVRIPEWEEAAATACAVHNMHLQASAEKDLACYWSSWHEAFRDSNEMKNFLGMEAEDKCLGLFIVAKSAPNRPDHRERTLEKHMNAEWRE